MAPTGLISSLACDIYIPICNHVVRSKGKSLKRENQLFSSFVEKTRDQDEDWDTDHWDDDDETHNINTSF